MTSPSLLILILNNLLGAQVCLKKKTGNISLKLYKEATDELFLECPVECKKYVIPQLLKRIVLVTWN